jgi:hypothetical protein
VPPQQAHGVVAHYSFDQLGVAGDLLKAVRSEPFGVFAPAGSTTFERIELPAKPASSLSAVADGEGFDVFLAGGSMLQQYDPVRSQERPTVLHSQDGRTFAPTEHTFGGMWVSAAGQVAGRIAVAGDGADDGFDIVASGPPAFTPSPVQVLHSADGRAWDAAGGTTMAFASSAGLLGTTPVVFGGNTDGTPVMMRRHGEAWTTTDLSTLVAHPAGTQVYAGNAGVGGAGAAMSVMIVNRETSKDGTTRDRGEPVNRLLTTRDGVTWHDQSLDDLVGRPRTFVNMIVVTDDRVVLTAAEPKTDEKAATAPRITLVGTPR